MHVKRIIWAREMLLKSCLSFGETVSGTSKDIHAVPMASAYLLGASAMARLLDEKSLAETLESDLQEVTQKVHKGLGEMEAKAKAKDIPADGGDHE